MWQRKIMESKIKILACGDVEGRFNILFKKIEIIQRKSGPFDLLICVGNVFGLNNLEFEPYKKGELKVPIATIILGANTEDHVNLFSENSIELCENIQYLGKRGVYITNGLRIAYLSGTFTNNVSKKDHEFNDEEVIALRDICLRANSNFRGVDILLTSQWPTDVTNEDSQWNKNTRLTSPSYHCAWLATELKPRYHISGLEGIFYERPPFRVPNSDLEIPTRFLGLARVGNIKKHKWIYALNLVPIDKMRISDLSQKTTDETACPYNINDLVVRVLKDRKYGSKEKRQYFYDMNVGLGTSEKKFVKKAKIEFDQSKCWFCLSSTSVEKHLIITVGKSVYVALAKGGLVDEHFLICPIDHYQCTVNQPDEIQKEVECYKAAITNFYKRNDKVPVFFERNYKTSHMQIQAVPISNNTTTALSQLLKMEGESRGLYLHELEKYVRCDQVLPANVPYFIIELPNGKTFYTKINGKNGFPLNFAREILVMGPILNMNNRAEWRDCILSTGEEIKLVERIRSDFEPFDITND